MSAADLIICACVLFGTFAGLLTLAPQRPTDRAFEGDTMLAAVTAVAAAIAVGAALT